jgi:hypothetical protein
VKRERLAGLGKAGFTHAERRFLLWNLPGMLVI